MAKKPNLGGRPRTLGDSKNCTFRLSFKDIEAIDKTARRLMRASGERVNRSEALRAIIRGKA